MIHENVIQMIGNTPITRLNRVTPMGLSNFYAKLEFMNPGGSVKDRIGYWLIEDAEKKGVIKPGGTIVEATSGNTGIGLAVAAAIKGYKCIFVLPDKMSLEKIKNLRAFGARVVVTPTAVAPDDPRSYYQVARQLARETQNAFYINQYDNLANRECHYKTTGPEILRQMPDVDVIVGGLGTGGTMCGIGRYVKEKKPSVKMIAVDPVGSIIYEYFKTGKIKTAPKTYKIEGIGEDFIPGNFDLSIIDDVVQIEDKESFLLTRDLLTKEGIYCGVSSGSALAGAIKWAKTQGESIYNKKILVIFPDSGNRYLSKAFDDDWMREAGLLDSVSLGKVIDLLHLVHPHSIKGETPIFMAKQTDKVSFVIELLSNKGISQLPVTDDAQWIKGIVTETSLLNALYTGKVKSNDIIESLIDASVEFVTPDDSIEKISKLITQGKVPLVHNQAKSGMLLAIITKIDLLNYLGQRI
ncbi:MAG: pyridoxal-phosphate dependent enzyme [Bdellovibrio sp.]|nr:pyridoxal-phosphate dependent enzyme [Bdellovibrio sp.]